MANQTCEKGPNLGFKELPTYKTFALHAHCVHGIPLVPPPQPAVGGALGGSGGNLKSVHFGTTPDARMLGRAEQEST